MKPFTEKLLQISLVLHLTGTAVAFILGAISLFAFYA